MGFAVLLGVMGIAACSAAVAGHRIYGEDRLKAVIAAMGIWMMLIAVPPYLLGWMERLNAVTVGLGVVLASIGVSALTLFRVESPKLTWMRRALGSTGSTPVHGFLTVLRAGTVVVLGPAAVVLLAIWTTYLAYLAPSNSWDGLWYHESIVGYAIQHQGFAWLDLPDRMQLVNGYPRMSEMFNLVAVIFSGRTLIDAVPSVMMIISFTAAVGLIRPLCASPVHAVGWASGLILVPAVVLPLRSSLIDVTFMTGFLVSLYFMTRPVFRLPDIVLGSLLTGMMGAMKGTGIAVAPVLFVIGAIRLVLYVRETRSRRALLALWAIVLSAAVLFSPTYVRNWMRTDNPIWPIRLSLLGYEFNGPSTLRMERKGAVEELFSPPKPDQMCDTRDNGYGNVLPFILPPLLAAALLSLLADAFRRRFGAAHKTLFWSLAAVLPSIAMSPAGLWWARLNLHLLAVCLMCGAWVVGTEKRRALAEGLQGALLIGSMLTLVWTKPDWQMPTDMVLRLTERTPEHRERARLAGTMLPYKIAKRRDIELGPETIIAYDGDYPFPAGLWNIDFSNKLVYLNRKSRNIKAVEALGPAWVVARNGTKLAEQLKDSRHWQVIGDVDKDNTAYRYRAR